MKTIFFKLFLFLVVACICMGYKTTESKMRRFTFASYHTLNDSTAIRNIQYNRKLKKELERKGVVNYDFCTIDSISYFVLDMEPSFNLKSTKKLFKELSETNKKLRPIFEIVNGKYKLLDRIYKFEQQKAYSAKKGQLIPRHRTSSSRFVLSLEIINDKKLAKEYVSVHSIGKAWPEITQNMKTVGIHEMELYLMGYRAFLIMDAKPDFSWDTDGKRWGELPRENEWQAYVAKFQKTDPNSKTTEKWKVMKCISMKD